MKMVRFSDKTGRAQYGIVEGAALAVMTGDPIQGLTRTGPSVPLAGARLLAPVEPVNVLCVGFARQPPVFLKPGDLFEVEIEGVGTLRHAVTREHRIAKAIT